MGVDVSGQDSGNYNVFCQSCGRMVAKNVETHQEALDLEEDHSSERRCSYTGTYKIKQRE